LTGFQINPEAFSFTDVLEDVDRGGRMYIDLVLKVGESVLETLGFTKHGFKEWSRAEVPQASQQIGRGADSLHSSAPGINSGRM